MAELERRKKGLVVKKRKKEEDSEMEREVNDNMIIMSEKDCHIIKG